MTNNIWYWEYQLEYFDDIDKKNEIRSGVVAANTIVEAMEEIVHYYGEDQIVKIQMLEAIVDGVYDFKEIMDDTNFNYTAKKEDNT